jgi:hypothetical protein
MWIKEFLNHRQHNYLTEPFGHGKIIYIAWGIANLSTPL